MANFQSLAMMTTVVAVGSTEAARIKKGSAPSIKPVISGFILGLFLFAFGAALESVATAFCYLIIVSSLLINGAALFAIAK